MNGLPANLATIPTDAMPAWPESPAARSRPAPAPAAVPLLPVTTLVLWLGCLAVGGLGLTLPYARPAPNPPPPPIQAINLEVELIRAPFSAQVPAPPRADAMPAPPPMLELIADPPIANMVAVAEPAPVIAFPLPVERPVRVVELDQAGYTTELSTDATESAVAPPAQTIAYGQGEGRQPAPEYPRQAVREGQEGVVTVRFSVGENGRVLAAEAVSAAPWPLLNDAALRVVRERWRFRPGPARFYEVAIRFELKS